MANTASLDIISPTFTDVHVRYQKTDSTISSSVSSPSAGTLGYLIEVETDILKKKVYYRTRVSLIWPIASKKVGGGQRKSFLLKIVYFDIKTQVKHPLSKEKVYYQ